MSTFTRFGFLFAMFSLCFFSSVLFSVAGALRFSITSDVSVPKLSALSSTIASFTISLDPLAADGGENKYSITLQSPCIQRDARGNCLDAEPLPDLCKYLTLEAPDGDSYDQVFLEDAKSSFYDEGQGRLFSPDRLESTWKVAVASPCFEGECPVNYDKRVYGLPVPVTEKGKTFKCEVIVKYQPPIFQVARSVAYAATSTDRIVISAVFGADAGCSENCFSNVAFLPGLEASRLYADPGCPLNCESRIWEPNRAGLEYLRLDGGGKSTTTYDIYTKDVIDSAYNMLGPNIYASFISDMNALKREGKINDWEALPYDWRLSLDDILTTGKKVVDRIYYGKSTSTPYILQEVKHLAATSKSGKVTLVAHSNGGLVAKALMRRLETEGLGSIVDKIIFVAVPQIGTPAAIGGMLHGEDQGIPADSPDFFFPKSFARSLAENAPGAYNLLPSYNYFTYVDTPPITFTNPLSSLWANYYGAVIHSQGRLHNFLVDTTYRSKPVDSELSSPNILNENLLNIAEGAHHDLDTWQPPPGVRVIQIAGWGIPVTLSSIQYTDSSVYPYGSVSYEPKFVSDGDGTVVVPSALWMNGSGTERYWVNLSAYNNGHRVTLPRGRVHVDLLEIGELRTFIKNQITNLSASLPTYISTTQPVVDSSMRYLQFSLHSPLSLDLFDDLGRHTGISTTTGRVEEGIPGTYYLEFGELKYIFSDESIPNHIRMNGQAVGNFTFNIKELEGDNEVASTTFATIPTTAQTRVTFDLPGRLATASNLMVDTDGNGVTDFSLTPKIDDTVTVDHTPPTTAIKLFGTKGKNDWYIGDVTVALNATDTESGVANTTYSIDSGITWLVYASTTRPMVSGEGTTTILYYSTDNLGNKESVSSITLKIDKTPPEIQVTFDPIAQKLKFTATDNLSYPTLVNSEGVSLATDDAGHTTQLSYLTQKSKQGRINLRITRLIYDLVSKSTPLSMLTYKWNTKNGHYLMLASYARGGNGEAETHFRPKTNQTILMKKAFDLDDKDQDDDCDYRSTKERLPGMVVVGFKTNKGVVSIIY